jgi:3-phenylpropionate/trans-cinnamate dioxygenase ferredoxin component
VTRHLVGPVDAVPIGGLREFTVQDRSLCLAHTAEGLFAFDALCTHEGYSLSEGELLGMEVECPQHFSKFDVRTGDVRGAPANEPLTTYPVIVKDGLLYVELADH